MGTVSVDPELADRIRARLVAMGETMSATALAAAVRAESRGVATETDVANLVEQLYDELIGAGPLEDLLVSPEVTDVLVCGTQVWLDGVDGMRKAELSFANDGQVRQLATRLATAAGQRLDDAKPFADAVLLPNSRRGRIRMHAILPPVSDQGTCLSLRIFRQQQFTLRQLVTPELAALLRVIVHARLSLVIAGGTGSGKSTLLSALTEEVPDAQRIIAIEDVAELTPSHPHFVRLLTRQANVEGAGAIELRELVRQALRMRPDRIIVGEVRGAEVCELFVALNSGHDGSATTIHANSLDEVPTRFASLAALGGWPREAVHSQLAATMQVVVFVERTARGQRQIREIGVVKSNSSQQQCRTLPVWRAGEWHAGRRILELLLAERGQSWPCA
jgi:pilus assembly protein CpaF